MGKLIDELRASGELPESTIKEEESTELLPPQDLSRDASEEERRERKFDRLTKIRSYYQKSFDYETREDDTDYYGRPWPSLKKEWENNSKHYVSVTPKEKWISSGGVVVDGLTPEALQMIYLVRPAGSAFGKLTLPKGRGEKDESKEVTALREVEEEAGIYTRFLPNPYLGEFDGTMSKTNYFLMFKIKATGRGHDKEIEKVELMHIDTAIEALEDVHNRRDVEVLKKAKVRIDEIIANINKA